MTNVSNQLFSLIKITEKFDFVRFITTFEIDIYFIRLEMEKNSTFDSWDEFETKLNEYRDATFQPLFRLIHGKTVEFANQKIKSENKFKLELKYTSVEIHCVHSGSYVTKAFEVSIAIVLFDLIIDLSVNNILCNCHDINLRIGINLY